MDKRTLLAFFLIAVVFVGWSVYSGMNRKTPPAVTIAKKADSIPTAATTPAASPVKSDSTGAKTGAANTTSPLTATGIYAAAASATSHFDTVETPHYMAILNTRGALLSRLILKDYKTWYGTPVQLICDSAGFPGVLGVTYKNAAGTSIPTQDLVYDINAPTHTVLKDTQSFTLTAHLALSGSATDTMKRDTAARAAAMGIDKKFTFHADNYGIGLEVGMQNMASEIAGGNYEINWDKGIMYQENNSVEESSKAKGMIVANDDNEEVDASTVGAVVRDTIRGTVEWVGIKGKYFASALIPSAPMKNSYVRMWGYAAAADSSGRLESYNYALGIPYSQTATTQKFTLFAGPLEYGIAKSFGVQKMIDFGAKFVRPIAEFFMLPIFTAIHSVVSNYGVVILLFSLLIRGLLWPFSIPQIKSSRKMQLLQPKVAELREKFKDDQQRQQMETMALYRTYGVNPVGGCLPMVLQLPMLYALWGTLSGAIQLRQASFALWIHDLSVPDVVAHLPFQIPLLGDKLSGLALLMGVTLFFQQKMMITDPKQKAMIYFMPVLLTLMFNHLPSGLNLYYLTFNLMAIGQQVYMSKYKKNTLTLEEMRREASTKKKGWFAQKMEDAQKMATMQQATTPRKPANGAVNGRTAVEPKKKNK